MANISIAQKPFVRPSGEWSGKSITDLAAVVAELKPHVLIGTSTQPGAFTERVVKEMAKHFKRPIILPLSNPTRLHEAVPADFIPWTEGRVLCATGSPFDPVDYKGTTYIIGECNKSCCFPGIGLGCVLAKASKLTDEMLMAAIKAKGGQAEGMKDPTKPLIPDVVDARSVSVAIATAVIKEARTQGLCREETVPGNDETLSAWVQGKMWQAEYPEYKKI